MVSSGKFTYYFANNGEKGVTILKIVTPKCPKPSKLSHLSQNCHTLFRANDVTLRPKFIHRQKPLMDELTRFIAETPLWLSIPFLAVFAAMWIWFFVLLWQALRGKFFSE